MFSCDIHGAVSVVSGSDPLSAATVPVVQALVESCFGRGQPKIVFSLAGIPLLDSVGLEFLVDLHARCMQQGSRLHLAAPGPLCAEILEVTLVGRRIPTYSDVPLAVGGFGQ